MRNIWVIAKRELNAYFYSPIAYVVTTIFVLVSGFFFHNILSFYSLYSIDAAQNQYMAEGLNFTEGIFIAGGIL